MYRFKKSLFVVFAVILALGINDVAAEVRSLPFEPGEKLEYSLHWSGIKAGTASLEVLRDSEINGKKACHFVMKARTTPFLDKIFKVRDMIKSIACPSLTKSYLFIKKQREGRHRKNITLQFDENSNTVQYISKKKIKAPIPIEPGTIDPLTALYYTRMMVKQGIDSVESYVTDGKKIVRGKVTIIKKEMVEVNGETHEAFLVEPDLKDAGGVFKKSKNARMRIWLSADERRIPLKIQSKVAVGNFSAVLVSDNYETLPIAGIGNVVFAMR